jgi:hypothetical protein
MLGSSQINKRMDFDLSSLAEPNLAEGGKYES